MRVELGKLARPTAEAESSPTACLSSPEPRHKEEDGADGRDPPVSDRVRERGCPRMTREALGPAWAGCKRAGLFHTVTFLFFPFVQNGFMF